jgi:hypothetical protein
MALCGSPFGGSANEPVGSAVTDVPHGWEVSEGKADRQIEMCHSV